MFIKKTFLSWWLVHYCLSAQGTIFSQYSLNTLDRFHLSLQMNNAAINKSFEKELIHSWYTWWFHAFPHSPGQSRAARNGAVHWREGLIKNKVKILCPSSKTDTGKNTYLALNYYNCIISVFYTSKRNKRAILNYFSHFWTAPNLSIILTLCWL